MSLRTQFERNDGTLESLNWGWWHLSCFADAHEAEVGPEPRLSSLTEYTFTDNHIFLDPTDLEVLEIRIGDKFRWWRDR